jgi:hypothetical protein
VSPSLIAGIVAGVVGLLVFLIVHHIWIKPIWMIFLPGLAVAALGGVAIGWGYAHISEALPARPWRSLAMLGVISALLLPGVLLSLTHGPLFDLATAKIRPGEGMHVAIRFALELVAPAMLVGAVLGWQLGGSWKAVLAMVLAALAFAIGPGHNVPMFGTSPSALKGFAILGIVLVPVAVVLVEVAAVLAARR